MIASVDDFKEQFDRDFDYGSTKEFVRDEDITRAFVEADGVFNPDIYPTEDTKKLAYLYLSAHFLVNDISASLNGGAVSLINGSTSVGSVSVSSDIPDWMRSGEMAFYTTTYYGQKWAILTKPFADGAVFSVSGGTQF